MSTLWHEFQHYKRGLEFRKPDPAKTEEVRILEAEEENHRPNNEIEATSIGLADYLDKMTDDDVKVTLRYLAEYFASADPRFRKPAIERIRKAGRARAENIARNSRAGVRAGDRTTQHDLLTLLQSLSKSDKGALDELIKAIQSDVAPAPKKKTK